MLGDVRKELQGVQQVLAGTNQEIRDMRHEDESSNEAERSTMMKKLSDTAKATLDWSETTELLQYTAERDLPLGKNTALGIT